MRIFSIGEIVRVLASRNDFAWATVVKINKTTIKVQYNHGPTENKPFKKVVKLDENIAIVHVQNSKYSISESWYLDWSRYPKYMSPAKYIPVQLIEFNACTVEDENGNFLSPGKIYTVEDQIKEQKRIQLWLDRAKRP